MAAATEAGMMPRTPSMAPPRSSTPPTPVTDFALIESQKENIRPLETGRSAATLSNMFGKDAVPDSVMQEGHERYRRLVDEAEKREREGDEMQDGVSDLLDAYQQHLSWAAQHCTSNNSYYLPLIESFTRRFLSDARYAQDVRYLKMWVMYTREVERREEVWAFLESKNVGTNHAQFYEEWASALEGLGRKKKADSIYQIGIARRAAPLERLKTRHRAFLQRILAASSDDIPNDEPLAPLRSAGRSVLGQVATTPMISGAVQLAPSNRSSRAPNGAKMGIFVDEPGHRGQDDAPGEWSDLGTRDERRKENVVEATPWKGETLPQKGVAPRTPKVEVFMDIVDKNEIVRPAAETLFKPKQLTEAEQLKKNPLRFYDTSDVPTTVPVAPAPPVSRKAPRPKVPAYVAQPWVCPTDGRLIKDSKGKAECRMCDWDAVFKNGEEWSFEEVRARERGLLGREWRGAVKEWETAWHLPGSSTPKAPPKAKKMPSPTVNTKLANEEIMAMFDQTIHRGKVRDDSDSESDSDEEDNEDEMPMQSAPTPLPSRAGPSMLPAHHMGVPPTPTPAQGHIAQNRSPPVAVFQDENAIPASTSKPVKFNVFSETPAKTPARTPLAMTTPRVLEALPREEAIPEAAPTPAPRPAFNIFATPAPASKAPARRNIFSNAISEEEEEEGQRYDQADSGADFRETNERNNRMAFPVAMTPITERTQEYTSMTNLRSSQSTNVFSVSSGRRSSVQSVWQDNEDIPAEDVGSAPNGLSAVYEEEERSNSRQSTPFDDSRSAQDVSDYQHLEESAQMLSRFEVPEGFTIHSRPAQDMQTMIVMDNQQDTMHTAREGSVEPESDTAAFVTANHGPIDIRSSNELPNPCVPVDEDVISILLSKIQPPLSSLPNFLDLRQTTSNRLGSLNSHTKVKARRSSAVPRPSVSADDRVSITLGDREFEVSDKIGEGGFGAVFLAVDVRLREQIEDADSDDEDEDTEVDRSLVAIKVEKPGAVWEAVILDRILSRLDPAQTMSIIRPRELIAFADESYLVLDFAPQGTLLDAVNKASSMGIAPATAGGPSALDELVAIFFTIELLHVIESLHRSQFIHGDMKIDNCLVRLDAIPSSEGGNSGWSSQYSAQGENGWRHKGLKLIDFGRGIDVSLFPAGEKQKFKADWKIDERDCVEIREDREWSYETDYFGVASICYCMLFGKYIGTEVGTAPDGKDGKWHKINTPLKRYWQAQLWNKLFDTLLNPNEVGSQLPINDTLGEIRGEFEAYLEENCQKGGKSLKSMLKKIELAALTNRR